MLYAVLSDIHGNMYAFRKVLEDMAQFDIKGVILLGDLIDYGMQSNEVADCLRNDFPYEVLCNIWGNHERAILTDDYSCFSSFRGVDCAKHTASLLTPQTRQYLNKAMNREGLQEFSLDGKKCLAVHASQEDHYWKAIGTENIRGEYSEYDLVFSGHSHYSHVFTRFYEADNPELRNKHAVRFINPGSVGQPRNHNPKAQYALLEPESMSIMLRAVSYDIDKAMALYDGSVDPFYQKRLLTGV